MIIIDFNSGKVGNGGEKEFPVVLVIWRQIYFQVRAEASR